MSKKHNPKRITLRIEAINHYGGRCARCGFSDHRALNFHHINGDGWKYRQDKTARSNGPLWLKRNGYPPIIEILCANCHSIHTYDDGYANE